MPVLGSVFGVILFGIGFKTLVDVIRGIQLISEIQLEVGRIISVDGKRGIIYKLGWTGIFITISDAVQFMTYGQLAKRSVLFHKANIPVVKHLYIKSSQENMNLMRQEEILNNQLFAHPMLSSQHKPLVSHKDDGLQVQLGVSDQSHLESFISQLEQENFDVTIID